MSALRSFFTERRPWAAVIVALLSSPFLGTLYLGRDGWSLFYLALELLIFAAPPDKGDIVVFKATKDADGVLIRRITGLPGERVRLAHGRDVTVPKGHYFVLGDHQNSRPGSLIPEAKLIGRVTHILWNGRQRKFRPASVR